METQHGIDIYPEVNPRIFDSLISQIVYNNVPLNRERGNSGTGRSMCFGIVSKRNGPPGPSRYNTKCPTLWKTLQDLASHLPVPEGWTSCVINQDYPCMPHVDSGNYGKSCIVSCGLYHGGELAVCDASGVKLLLNTCNKPVVGEFNKVLHYVLPLSGFKISLIYFRCRLPSDPPMPKHHKRSMTEEEAKKYIDPLHMFNPVPGVSRKEEGRHYVAIDIPNPEWSGLTVRPKARAVKPPAK